MYVNKTHCDWDQYLDCITYAYNHVVHASTGYTPYYLLHGREGRSVTDLKPVDPRVPIAEHFEKLHKIREIAIEATRETQKRQKRYYDAGRYEHKFRVGDKVLVFRPRGAIGQSTRFRHPFEGPFEVVAGVSCLNFKVRDLRPNARQPTTDTVHVSRLKPYVERMTE